MMCGLSVSRQPGAPGAHLAWGEHPDKTVPLFPQGTCGCGRDLTDAADLGVAGSHQVIDTSVATAAVTQYEKHTVACRAGGCTPQRPRPAPAGPGR
jgi:transposase